MDTLSRLEVWRDSGEITPEQFAAIEGLVKKTRFSVFFELNALLYLGVLSLVGGLALLIEKYVDVGPTTIVSGLTLLFVACLVYCFSQAEPYSSQLVEGPSFLFDYVLYAGCLTFAFGLGYVESKFHFLGESWDVYLLASAILYAFLAYRFDNRFVLSLALSTLAAWFGIRVSNFDLISVESLRLFGFAYGILVASCGLLLRGLDIKAHFFETFVHVSATALFVTLLSGVFSEANSNWYLIGLLLLSAGSIWGGAKLRRFAFVLYGVAYGYIGISAKVLDAQRLDSPPVLAYFVVSGALIVALIIGVARRFGKSE